MYTQRLISRRPAGASHLACGLVALTFCACAGDPAPQAVTMDGSELNTPNPERLRQLIDSNIGIDKLRVPDADHIPGPVANQTRLPDGMLVTDAYRYETTDAKRYLGKLLFHDPVRTARVNVNVDVTPVAPQPYFLPAGTAFGGTVAASDPRVQAVVDSTRLTGSCGSCHIGEAAGKAGTVLNFNTGGEGRGYTDEQGNFIPRRRAQSGLIARQEHPGKLFEGDTGVDSLPTLTDIYTVQGQTVVTTPARQKATPLPSAILATGRLDELDSVGRQSPSMIGFAFNNRLLFGGFGGNANSLAGGLNPLNDPAQENLTLLLLDAHRMFGFQSAELQKYPAFVELFRRAFPREAAAYDACKKANGAACLNQLVNDDTELRATATFLRAAVTRNTPFDRFLAGDAGALSARQRRGAALFFTKATDGGAGCFSCHSGPMLNKQFNDPDITGVGALVEENFFNVGIGDHPVQALNALRRGNLRFDPANLDPSGNPIHGEDTGRQEITGDAAHAYKFRSLTLRQLKDARTFFHNGSFTSVRDVVAYFNAGVAQDQNFAGRAATLEPRFTNPRGNAAPRGLGLNPADIDALTDFLENGLYDAGFAADFQPTDNDLDYANNNRGLAGLLGTGPQGGQLRNGRLISGKAIDNDDPLTRRDEGLQFRDVTRSVTIARAADDQYTITNSSDAVIDTHLLVIAQSGSIANASGQTRGGVPIEPLAQGAVTVAGRSYLRVFLPGGVLTPGQSIRVKLQPGAAPQFQVLSGQGTP